MWVSNSQEEIISVYSFNAMETGNGCPMLQNIHVKTISRKKHEGGGWEVSSTWPIVKTVINFNLFGSTTHWWHLRPILLGFWHLVLFLVSNCNDYKQWRGQWADFEVSFAHIKRWMWRSSTGIGVLPSSSLNCIFLSFRAKFWTNYDNIIYWASTKWMFWVSEVIYQHLP